LTEFDLVTLQFYRERELRRWQPNRVFTTLWIMVASFEQKMPYKVGFRVLAGRLPCIQRSAGS